MRILCRAAQTSEPWQAATLWPNNLVPPLLCGSLPRPTLPSETVHILVVSHRQRGPDSQRISSNDIRPVKEWCREFWVYSAQHRISAQMGCRRCNKPAALGLNTQPDCWTVGSSPRSSWLWSQNEKSFPQSCDELGTMRHDVLWEAKSDWDRASVTGREKTRKQQKINWLTLRKVIHKHQYCGLPLWHWNVWPWRHRVVLGLFI